MPPIPLAIALLALAGLLLLALGLRGRRLDDHPVCRRCRFDLNGSPGTARGEGRCPECGRSLDQPRAIRIGQRRRQPAAIVAGSLLLLIALAGGAFIASGADWTSHKPLWLLEREAQGTDARAASSAIAELARRIGTERLSGERAARVIDLALDHQTDRNDPLLADWIALIEAGAAVDFLSPAALARYYAQAVPLTVRSRPTVPHGGFLPVEVRVGRAAIGSGRPVQVRYRMEEVEIAGEARRAWVDGARTLTDGRTPFGDSATIFFIPLAGLPPGSFEVEGVLEVEVYPDMEIGNYEQRTPVATRRLPMDLRVEVLDEDAPLAQMIEPSPQQRAAMEQAFHIAENYGPRRPNRRSIAITRRKSGSLQGALRVVHPPLPYAFEIVLVDERGREWPAGHLKGPAGDGTRMTALSISPNDLNVFDARLVDLVLRPNPAAAERSIDLLQIADVEIVIENVPVDWPEEPEGRGDGE